MPCTDLTELAHLLSEGRVCIDCIALGSDPLTFDGYTGPPVLRDPQKPSNDAKIVIVMYIWNDAMQIYNEDEDG